jgi:hypothetical protein
MGAVLLLITIGVFWMASTGTTFEDKDCTAALITLPFGLYLLFTRHIVIQ